MVPSTSFSSTKATDANLTALASDGSVGVSAPTTPSFSPLYQQIKALILQSLQAGEWKPGDLIPSELELASRFRVSQGTVRKAIDELSAENLLTRRQGKGTFVTTHSEQQVQYRFLRLRPDSSNRNTQGPAERHILNCQKLKAAPEIAKMLGMRTGEAVVQIQRVLSFHGLPTILENVWLPGNLFKTLSRETLANDQGPMYALFESQFGVRMVRADERLKAVAAHAEAAHLLRVPTGFPLLSVERVAYTYNDTPVEYRQGLYRTDHHHYHNELS